MPFQYIEGSKDEFPSLGEDYSDAYGYAQTHECLLLWVKIAKAYDKDVRENGTTPSNCRFIDLAPNFWNECMGNVDTVRNMLKKCLAIRGNDSGPGSLTWSDLTDYIAFQANCIYQYSASSSF